MLSPTEEVKARLDIVDIVGAHLQLKRAGANFKALCPFHSEKTPSFMISQPKQMWYCFGCNEGGDLFKFVMKVEGLDFPEALKLLADKAGVRLPKYDKAAESRRHTLLEIMRAAVDFYKTELSGPRGAQARQYLIHRGLSEDIIKRFTLGYAPDSWEALSSVLHHKFKPEDIFAAGLTVRSERNQEFYDRFRHRIMFPIRDVHGTPVGFTSRLLDEKRDEGKYINTPETLIYSKSRILYGLDLAREEIRKAGYAVLVEGNMDVIACHQFGMTNVVASSGTALALDQVRLLKRYAGNIKVAFDADPAGESAAKRGIDLALAEGLRLKVITFPESCGKDPDECVRKDTKIWTAAVRDAHEIMDYYLERARTRYGIDSAQGRSQFVNTLLIEINKLPDLIEQDFWLKKIGETVKVDERLLREQMVRMRNVELRMKNIDNSAIPDLQKPVSRPRNELISDHLLALFLYAPFCSEAIIAAVLPEMFPSTTHRSLYNKLVECYTNYNIHGPATAGANFRQFWRRWAVSAASEFLSTADILEMLGDKEFEGWGEETIRREAQFLISEVRREFVKRRRLELAEAMRQAERVGDRMRTDELAREFETLAAQS